MDLAPCSAGVQEPLVEEKIKTSNRHIDTDLTEVDSQINVLEAELSRTIALLGYVNIDSRPETTRTLLQITELLIALIIRLSDVRD